jgi:nitroreductase
MEAIAQRQACRADTPEQLTEQDLTAVLQAANAAPVGLGKYHEVKLTVVQDKAMLERIDAAGAAFSNRPGAHPTYGAPTLIIVSAIQPTGPRHITPHCNAACIVENMALAATDLRLWATSTF